VLTLGGLLLLGALDVVFHELGVIELGLLEELDLGDEDGVKGEDLGAFFLDVVSNLLGDAV
jgi:hypothetical protein